MDDPIAEILAGAISDEQLRAAVARYRALAELPENAAIRHEILKVVARFEARIPRPGASAAGEA